MMLTVRRWGWISSLDATGNSERLHKERTNRVMKTIFHGYAKSISPGAVRFSIQIPTLTTRTLTDTINRTITAVSELTNPSTSAR
jgi:hypothetical protein